VTDREPQRERSDVPSQPAFRSGFALLTVVVAVAVVVTLGAVVAVSLRGMENQRAVEEAAADLLLFDAALTSFRQAAPRYPLQLSHVAAPPTASDKESCGAAWNAAWSSDWQTKAPFGPFYRKRAIPVGTGFDIGIGFVMDTMIRTPAGTGAGTLRIRILRVTESDANDLDAIVDASDGGGAGKVRWTTVTGGIVDTLNFIHTRANTSC
jgi:type II secretory pathway pseudopilin PulG